MLQDRFTLVMKTVINILFSFILHMNCVLTCFGNIAPKRELKTSLIITFYLKIFL